MRNGFAGCCHYDEGYDDGFDDGKEEIAETVDPTRDATVFALRLLARAKLLDGASYEAALLERLADEVEADDSFEKKIERARERDEEIAKAYAAQKQVAA